MSHVIPASSTSVKALAARRLGEELTVAARTRGVGRRRLSEMCGVSETLIAQYRSGYSLPLLDAAGRLADALAWPALLAIVREARRGRCARCGQHYINDSGAPKRFCSPHCRTVAAKLRSAAGGLSSRRQDLATRLDEYIGSVDSCCRSCEPSGVCRAPACTLRRVSPLLLAPESSQDTEPSAPRLLPPAVGPTRRPTVPTADVEAIDLGQLLGQRAS